MNINENKKKDLKIIFKNPNDSKLVFDNIFEFIFSKTYLYVKEDNMENGSINLKSNIAIIPLDDIDSIYFRIGRNNNYRPITIPKRIKNNR